VRNQSSLALTPAFPAAEFSSTIGLTGGFQDPGAIGA
jgi:hypothetical protein